MEKDTHYCFISYKKEDRDGKINYVKKVEDALEKGQCLGKALDVTIPGNIDEVIKKIRQNYMNGTSVTILLIGEHSSENEGLDGDNFNKQNFLIRELQASLYNTNGFDRNGLLGIVLPNMYSRIYGENQYCDECKSYHRILNLGDETVIREFWENFWLEPNKKGCMESYSYDGEYAVLVKYDEFIVDPSKYVNLAFEKRDSAISKKVHWRNIKHAGKMR